MNNRTLIDDLAKSYKLIVNSEYHLQIEATGGKHDIWFTKKGEVKFKACGQQATRVVTPEQLKMELAKYSYDESDLALMRGLSLVVRKAAGRKGIFCDAGFSDGRARIAILRGTGQDYDIAVRQIEIATNVLAEDWAIKEAMRLYPGDEPVYSDCEPAVKMNAPRAVWIPRKNNKEADHFGNMRGKNK